MEQTDEPSLKQRLPEETYTWCKIAHIHTNLHTQAYVRAENRVHTIHRYNNTRFLTDAEIYTADGGGQGIQ